MQEGIEIEYTRPQLTNYQRDIIDCPKRYTVVQAATKVGKTAVCAVWLIEQALEKGAPGRYFLWLAPVYSQARIAFDKYRYEIAGNGLFTKYNETDLSLTLVNGAIIVFRSADKVDNLYGFEYWAVVFDEFTRAKESAWTALRSTITATNAPVKFIGNVTGGKKNWGAILSEKAKTAGEDSPYAFFKITAYDAAAEGLLDLDEILQAERDLPFAAFKELYLAEVTDDGSNVFGFDHIDRCTGPLSSKPAVCYGVDLARKSDHTVIIGLDEDCRVCYFARFQHDWEYQIAKICLLPKDKRLRVDSTGVGDVVTSILEKDFPLLDPFIFTQKSKQQIIEGLAVSIQQHKVIFPEGVITDELKNLETTFTRTGVSYQAVSGMNDDAVMALALAVSAWSSSQSMGLGHYSFNF